MWRQLCRRHVQLHLLLLLLSLFVVALFSSKILPGYTKDEDDRSSYSDGSSHGSEEDLDVKARRRVRRNVAVDVAENDVVGAGGSNRTLYVVTATYPRPEQEAELLRLSQTLMHAKPFVFWVVVEDSRRTTPAVTELLQRSGLRHVHLLGT